MMRLAVLVLLLVTAQARRLKREKTASASSAELQVEEEDVVHSSVEGQGLPGTDRRGNIDNWDVYKGYLEGEVAKCKGTPPCAKAESNLASCVKTMRKMAANANKPKPQTKNPGCCCHGLQWSKAPLKPCPSTMKIPGQVCWAKQFRLSDCEDMSDWSWPHTCLTGMSYYEYDKPSTGCAALNKEIATEKKQDKKGHRTTAWFYNKIPGS